MVKLDTGNLQDIPDMLRRYADQLESGLAPMPTQLAMVTADAEGGVCVRCFGDLPTILVAVGLLQFGILHLTLEQEVRIPR